jgi:hypothetical protein
MSAERSAGKNLFSIAKPTEAELSRQLPGDDMLSESVLVIDSAMTLHAPPAEVWPWIQQVGRRDDEPPRSGWYLPHKVERFFLEEKRALRTIEPGIKPLEEGDHIRDWFGKTAMIDVVTVDQPNLIVLAGERGGGKIRWNWTVSLQTQGEGGTRLQSRTRIAGLRDNRFNHRLGKVVDRIVASGLQAGLNERLTT